MLKRAPLKECRLKPSAPLGHVSRRRLSQAILTRNATAVQELLESEVDIRTWINPAAVHFLGKALHVCIVYMCHSHRVVVVVAVTALREDRS